MKLTTLLPKSSNRFMRIACLSLFGLTAANVTAADAPAQYQSSCFACHSTGAMNAPKSFDAEAWAPRMEAGKEAMVESVKKGKGGMPPMGLCADCSDEDFALLIEYMAGSKFE